MTRYAALHAEPETPAGEPMWSRNLLALYETDPEIIASVLPKPLEVAEPWVRANLPRWTCPMAHCLREPSRSAVPATVSSAPTTSS